MRKIKLTQGKFALVDDEDFEELNKYKWSTLKHTHTYYACRVYKKYMILMHRVVLKAKKGEICDHINRNGLNNTRSNLRIATRRQNAINSKINARNTSGHTGVSWDKSRKKWVVRSKINGKYLYLGRYNNKDLAIEAYEAHIKNNNI